MYQMSKAVWIIKVDMLDTDKLGATPVDLNKLSDVVKSDVVKKTEYNELVKKS